MKKYLIANSKTIIQAIEKINEFSAGQSLVLFVLNDDDKIIGSVSDGDIRRALIKGYKLSDNIQLSMNKKFNFLKENDKNIIQKITHRFSSRLFYVV